MKVSGCSLVILMLMTPALGNTYVDSSSNPITLNMTFNTTNASPPNAPIAGVIPKFSFDEATGILRLIDGEYVDNASAGPGATGCTLTLFGIIPTSINGLVNSQSGLPPPAGTNKTRQIIDIDLNPAGLVTRSWTSSRVDPGRGRRYGDCVSYRP